MANALLYCNAVYFLKRSCYISHYKSSDADSGVIKDYITSVSSSGTHVCYAIASIPRKENKQQAYCNVLIMQCLPLTMWRQLNYFPLYEG